MVFYNTLMYHDLERHFTHDVTVAKYGETNIVIECMSCGEVLFDVEKE